MTSTPSAVQVADAMVRFGLRADGPPWPSPRSVVRPVIMNGRAGVLKVTHDPEERLGALALDVWAGEGAVRVLARDGAAVVLERAGATLRARAADDAATTREICAVAARLHRCEQAEGFRSLRSWFGALFTDGTPQLARVRAIADRLLSTPGCSVLLHGDLHSENVLDGGARGWLAIDPKGLVGPREFDHCTLFTNWTRAQARERFDERLRIVTTTAGIDRAVLLRWIAAWSALSALWSAEDGDDERAALARCVTGLALDRLDGEFPRR